MRCVHSVRVFAVRLRVCLQWSVFLFNKFHALVFYAHDHLMTFNSIQINSQKFSHSATILNTVKKDRN